MNPEQAAIIANSINAKPTIRIIDLTNPSIIYVDIQVFLKQMRAIKIPSTKSLEISLEGCEDVEHPLIAIKINDRKIPRFVIQIQWGTPIPDLDKLADFLRKGRFYWLISYIECFGLGQEAPIKRDDVWHFFKSDYEKWVAPTDPKGQCPPPAPA